MDVIHVFSIQVIACLREAAVPPIHPTEPVNHYSQPPLHQIVSTLFIFIYILFMGLWAEGKEVTYYEEGGAA